MDISRINNLTVVGAGLMGSGIAQEFATAGYKVHLYDIEKESLLTAIERITSNLQMLNEFGLVSAEQVKSVPEKIIPTADMGEAVSDADLVVEAVIEDIEIKRMVFADLDSLCPARTIFASTTSTIKPNTLASATHRPDKVVVAHFGIPNYLIPLVEMARADDTSDDTVNKVYSLLERVGKRPVVIKNP